MCAFQASGWVVKTWVELRNLYIIRKGVLCNVLLIVTTLAVPYSIISGNAALLPNQLKTQLIPNSRESVNPATGFRRDVK